jgi:hypothetical protein
MPVPVNAARATLTAPGLAPALTMPSTGGYTVNLSSGARTGYDFGVCYAQSDCGGIQGLVSVDSNGSGDWTPGDRPLPGVTVYLDLAATAHRPLAAVALRRFNKA